MGGSVGSRQPGVNNDPPCSYCCSPQLDEATSDDTAAAYHHPQHRFTTWVRHAPSCSYLQGTVRTHTSHTAAHQVQCSPPTNHTRDQYITSATSHSNTNDSCMHSPKQTAQDLGGLHHLAHCYCQEAYSQGSQHAATKAPRGEDPLVTVTTGLKACPAPAAAPAAGTRPQPPGGTKENLCALRHSCTQSFLRYVGRCYTIWYLQPVSARSNTVYAL